MRDHQGVGGTLFGNACLRIGRVDNLEVTAPSPVDANQASENGVFSNFDEAGE